MVTSRVCRIFRLSIITLAECWTFLDQAGNGGTAQSGNAYGGNAWKRGNTPTFNFGKGGNAQSGNSGNADGGNVVNGGGFIWNQPFASKHPLEFYVL